MELIPKFRTNIISALVQIMAWCRPMAQAIIWINDGQSIDAYMRHSPSIS